MKRRTLHLFVSFLVLVLCADIVFAQARSAPKPRGGGQTLRIRSIEGLGRKGQVRTPEYKTSFSRSVGKTKEWQMIEVIYDTAPAWIDELAFNYYVMSAIKENGVLAFSIYRISVRYIDIEKGSDHRSTVFVHPNAVKRYGQVVAIAVEIMQNGKAIDEKSDESGIKLRDKWWKDPEVMGNKNMTVRDGYLYDRSRSPFALINIDDYEVIR